MVKIEQALTIKREEGGARKVRNVNRCPTMGQRENADCWQNNLSIGNCLPTVLAHGENANRGKYNIGPTLGLLNVKNG